MTVISLWLFFGRVVTISDKDCTKEMHTWAENTRAAGSVRHKWPIASRPLPQGLRLNRTVCGSDAVTACDWAWIPYPWSINAISCFEKYFKYALIKCEQWEKEHARHCCTADACLCQSVNQLYNNQKLVFFLHCLIK